ncbi:MAG TPA: NADP-dependent oxidoreductase [Solirubrobacteraceae bacterium]|nr:NADP-dependent oxidoreductase [Solirubrobacteraceae bacterium]
MRAVRFDRYGDVDVLEVREVERPSPGPGQALVRVQAAGINPGEASIRKGLLHERWPASFPSGQGSDLAGVVEQLGDGVEGLAVGDEVIGFTDERASQAELVAVDARNLTAKPAGVPWEVAGALFVAGTTAYAAVRAVAPAPGETLAVSAAAGGVGSLAVQLARLACEPPPRVIGIAGEANHAWLRGHGVEPVAYGESLSERLRALLGAGRLAAFIDAFGGGYVELAIELGAAPERIDTIIDREAAARYGTKTDGTAAAASAHVLGELAGLIDAGRLELPIAATFPLERVRDAYSELERRHTRGKIVLIP